jgi:hypothetical protein
VLSRQSKSARRLAGIALAALTLAVAAPAEPAFAQGFFEALFGGMFRSRPERRPLPPSVSAYADPRSTPSREPTYRSSNDYSGPAGAYCVRTCDGRFFPLQRHANASPADLCKSFCPAAKTVVFSGSKIDTAVASNGTRYADLENAFAYRERLVDSCTCNGKEPFGLVRVDVKNDPTLRSGDIVATSDGLATVRNPRTAEFTPIKASETDLGRRLSATKVVPIAPQAKVEPVPDEPPTRKKERRRAHSR